MKAKADIPHFVCSTTALRALVIKGCSLSYVPANPDTSWIGGIVPNPDTSGLDNSANVSYSQRVSLRLTNIIALRL